MCDASLAMKTEPKPDKPADPKCAWCKGKGFYYSRGQATTCRCRYNKKV